MREDHSPRSSAHETSKSSQVTFPPDLSEYIRTGVDPTGRYAEPATRSEKRSFALVYVFIGVMIIVGLLSSGVGRKLLEELLRLIQGG